MRLLGLLICFSLLAATAASARQDSPSSRVAVSVGDALDSFVTPPTGGPVKADVVRAVQSIQVPRSKWLTPTRLGQIASAVKLASQQTSVDPYLLVAVARTESDFRRINAPHANCYKPGVKNCMADCGITQHWLHGNPSWVLRRCKKIAASYRLSFQKSAQEIAQHIRWCKKHPKYHRPLKRCVLNRYNAGPRYKTNRTCRRDYVKCKKNCPAFDPARPNQTYPKFAVCQHTCRRSFSRCWGRSNYWKKVLCFQYGARNQIRARCSCRSIQNLTEITTKFYLDKSLDK